MLQLFAVSFLALFLELAFIRYINSTVQVVAYFNNFLILSAFLGLGVGSSYANVKRDWLRWLPLAFPAFMLLIAALDRFGYISDNADVVFWARGSGRTLAATPVMFAIFCANCCFFMPIGYRLGTTLNRFDDRLKAYGADLAGSFAGVVAFTLVAYLQSQPWTWFALAAAVTLWLLRDVPASQRMLYAAGLAAGVGLATLPSHGIWSPYYKVSFEPYVVRNTVLGYAVLVDKLRIQDALGFTPELERTPLAPWVGYYRLPYDLRAQHKVLILGGGSGNDAAMALRQGAGSVEVVEIDPVLVGAGHYLHPEKPYADPRVHVATDDARAFLRRDTSHYDLVVMNALDSHHQLPGLSTLRLESFIYTVQAFQDAKQRLAPDGMFIVHLSSTRPWMGQRLHTTLTQAFGRPPHLLTTAGSPFRSVAFAFGPDSVFQRLGQGVVELPSDEARDITVGNRPATDDWPHLYLQTNEVPLVYVQLLSLIVLFAVALLYRSARRLGDSGNLHFFLLGAGFMLLETRSITQAALLFGSTWLVNSIVIGAILLVLMLGNQLLRMNARVPKRLSYMALVTSLVIGYLVSPAFILRFDPMVRVLLAAAWFGMPVFFASLVFSESFRHVRNTAQAFGANLLGVVLGGALEYLSMMLGLNALYLIALAVYVAAWLLDRQGPRTAVAVADPGALPMTSISMQAPSPGLTASSR